MLITNRPVTPLAEQKYTPLSSSCADGMSRIPLEGRKREREREGEGEGKGGRVIQYGMISVTETVTSTQEKPHIPTHHLLPECSPQAGTRPPWSTCTRWDHCLTPQFAAGS